MMNYEVMNYEEFKEVVKNKLMDYMPKKFKEMKLEVFSVPKVNMILDGIVLQEKGKSVSPVLYINDLYRTYQNCGNLEATLLEGCDFLEEAYEKTPFTDLNVRDVKENVNEKIVFCLINTEQNKALLEQVPHRGYLDLSIVYRIVVSVDRDGVQSTIITNALAASLGMSEEQIYMRAIENTKRIFPPVVYSMHEMLAELCPVGEMLPEMNPDEQIMWIITNNKGINGAASMLYEDELHALAERMESDLYILPSSVHEVIVVPSSEDFNNPDELARLVLEVNMQQVALDERLSNQVYFYKKDMRKITLATTTPFKRLDSSFGWFR